MKKKPWSWMNLRPSLAPGGPGEHGGPSEHGQAARAAGSTGQSRAAERVAPIHEQGRNVVARQADGSDHCDLGADVVLQVAWGSDPR